MGTRSNRSVLQIERTVRGNLVTVINGGTTLAATLAMLEMGSLAITIGGLGCMNKTSRDTALQNTAHYPRVFFSPTNR
jgi:hypothetical protein